MEKRVRYHILTSYIRPYLSAALTISSHAKYQLLPLLRWYSDCRLYMSIATQMYIQVMHARSGVPHEIMGLMQGKVVGTSIVIMDSFALPVQGTETRVNAANEANEYMVEYMQGSEKVR